MELLQPSTSNPAEIPSTTIVQSKDGVKVVGIHALPRESDSAPLTIVTVATSGLVRGYQADGAASWEKAWEWQAACKSVECTVSDYDGGW